jgi:hypothetical protein
MRGKTNRALAIHLFTNKLTAGKCTAADMLRAVMLDGAASAFMRQKGVHAAGVIGSDFQKLMETQTPLGRIAQPLERATTLTIRIPSRML